MIVEQNRTIVWHCFEKWIIDESPLALNRGYFYSFTFSACTLYSWEMYDDSITSCSCTRIFKYTIVALIYVSSPNSLLLLHTKCTSLRIYSIELNTVKEYTLPGIFKGIICKLCTLPSWKMDCLRNLRNPV